MQDVQTLQALDGKLTHDFELHGVAQRVPLDVRGDASVVAGAPPAHLLEDEAAAGNDDAPGPVWAHHDVLR